MADDCTGDCDCGNHKQKHQCDKPGGTIGSLWGGLGDAEEIDEEGKERAHGDWMITEAEKNLYFLHPER